MSEAMAKGKAVSLDKRHDVFHARRNLKLSPASIRDLYFIDRDGNHSIALRTVEKMCRLIDQPSPDDMDVDIFLEGPKTVRVGRPRMLVGQDVSFLRRLYNRVAPRGKMKDMHKLFTKSYMQSDLRFHLKAPSRGQFASARDWPSLLRARSSKEFTEIGILIES